MPLPKVAQRSACSTGSCAKGESAPTRKSWCSTPAAAPPTGSDMRIAILDPFSGISGDMTLGALLGVGLDPAWLRALPERLGIADIGVEIKEVLRGELVCWKVDFRIPPQPHGRHISQIRELVARSAAPELVREKANAAFWAIA